jgi:hypothetical protein
MSLRCCTFRLPGEAGGTVEIRVGTRRDTIAAVVSVIGKGRTKATAGAVLKPAEAKRLAAMLARASLRLQNAARPRAGFFSRLRGK